MFKHEDSDQYSNKGLMKRDPIPEQDEFDKQFDAMHKRCKEAEPKVDKGCKYRKHVASTTIDVYDVITVFEVNCPAIQHAIKKLLAAGKRGAKSQKQDLEESIVSIERAIELSENYV